MKHLLSFLFCVTALAQNPNTAVYPAATPTDNDLLPATNLYTSTLTNAMTATSLTVPLASVAGLRLPAAITVDTGANAEIVKVCAIQGGAGVICVGGRGYDGTTARSHAVGARVVAAPVATMFNQLAAEIKALATTLPGGSQDGQVPTWSIMQGRYVPLQPAAGGSLPQGQSAVAALGLGNAALRTSADFDVAGAAAAAQAASVPLLTRGQINGVATLDSAAKLPAAQLPDTAVQRAANGAVPAVFLLLGPKTIAAGADQLPAAAAGNNGYIVVVKDAANSSDCALGGGTAISLCRSSGVAWIAIGGGVVSGTFAAPTPYNSGTTYAALATALYNGVFYVSGQDGNVGHAPNVSPTWWAVTGVQGATGAQGAKGDTGNTGAAGASAYVYLAWASDASGTGFTTTYNSALDFIAIKATTSPIASPVASDFSGLWKNYKGPTGLQGIQGIQGIPGVKGDTGPTGSLATADTSHSGGFFLGGLTSGYTALSAQDVAGTAVTYLMPNTDGTGKFLQDTGVVNCSTYATLAANMPNYCHLLAWTTVSGTSVNVNGSLVSNPNLNGTNPAVETGYVQAKLQISGSNVSVEVPTGTSADTAAAGNDSRITGAEQATNKGAANGYPALDSSAKILATNIPNFFVVKVNGVTVATVNQVNVIAGSGITASGDSSGNITLIATGASQAATPTSNPVPGTYASTQTVTLACTSPTPTIFYTTDGSTPTGSSSTYSTGLTVATTQTIKAICRSAGLSDSNVFAGTFTITSTVAMPTFNNDAGTYSNDVSVTISDSTSGAAVCYTTNGTTPAASTPGTCSTGSTYASPVPIASTGTTLKALGTKSAMTSSAIKSATYTLQVATPTATPTPGTVSIGTTIAWGSATTGTVTYHYRTDGVDPTCSTGTTGASTALTVSTTYRVVGCKANYADSAVLTAAYTVGGSAYLVNQNFEAATTGYDNSETWSNTSQPATTTNPAYTTSPLLGSQSLYLAPGTSQQYVGVYKSFTASAHIYFFFMYKPVTVSTADAGFAAITDASGTDLMDISTLVGSPGNFGVWPGSGSNVADVVDGAPTSGTTYYLWGEYQAGTGANGVMNLWVSTTSTKPATPQIAVTTATMTANAARIYFETSAAGGVSYPAMFDHVLVSTSPIGSNP